MCWNLDVVNQSYKGTEVKPCVAIRLLKTKPKITTKKTRKNGLGKFSIKVELCWLTAGFLRRQYRSKTWATFLPPVRGSRTKWVFLHHIWPPQVQSCIFHFLELAMQTFVFGFIFVSRTRAQWWSSTLDPSTISISYYSRNLSTDFL